MDTLFLPPFPTYENQITFNHCYFDAFGCSDQLYFTTCDAGTIIGGDPGFIDTASGDYRLSACSMLRDAGSNTGLANVPTDLAGNLRIQDGTVDIGVYETPGFSFIAPSLAAPICTDTASGDITLQTSSGCEPYTVTWQNGAQSGTGLSNLSAGTYFLSITDQGGRLLRDTVEILHGGYPEVDTVVQPVVCGQTAGGSAELIASGGLLPYTYRWANGSTQAMITGLATGIYQATVSDAAGCTTLAEAVVSTMGVLDLWADVQPISCFGETDGALSVLPLNGLAPYLYQWSGNQQTPELFGLPPGPYYATVTDALGCSSVYLFQLTEPPLLTASVDSTAASGLLIADGSLTAAGQGGTEPYQYVWSSGDQTPVADMLLPGVYELTLTDQHGCTFAGTYSVPYTIGTEETSEQLSALLYPNPARDITRIHLRNWPAGKVLLSGLDMKSRQVWSRSLVLTGGMEVVDLPVEDLPAGTYRLVLQADSGVSVRMDLVVVR